MIKKTTKWLDPILLVGVLVSVAIAVGMVLLGNDTISSLVVGLISTTITLLVDIVARIGKHEDTTIESARLSHILSDEPLAEKLRDIMEIYSKIRQYEFDYYNFSLKDDC